MARRTDINLRLRVDFGAAASVGPGKIALLEHIERQASLSQAARELGMSYRRAWQLMTDLNRSFSQAVATASTGGFGGGGASLTPFGRKLVKTYRALERQATASARRKFSRVATVTDPAARPKRMRLSRRPKS
ncbi:MAG: winged helix-turn-helix domain-containing protein [Steroidobacteraceae bacterium]